MIWGGVYFAGKVNRGWVEPADASSYRSHHLPSWFSGTDVVGGTPGKLSTGSTISSTFDSFLPLVPGR